MAEQTDVKSDGGQKQGKKPAEKFKIMIDQRLFEWSEPFITGADIKNLAGVDPSFGVWLQLPGPNDPEIGDNEKVDLSKPGNERFFTGKKTTTEGGFGVGSSQL